MIKKTQKPIKVAIVAREKQFAYCSVGTQLLFLKF